MKFLLIFVAIYLFSMDKYQEYVNKLLNYHFKLDYNIRPPFEEVQSKKNAIKKVIKWVDIKPILIFNDKALVKVYFYKNSSLIMVKKMWVKKNKKIENCIIKNIQVDKIVVKCGKKIKVKTLSVPLKIKEKTW